MRNNDHVLVKKWMTCLGCGDKMWTDKNHRICKKCERRNDNNPMKTVYRISDPSVLRDIDRNDDHFN